MFKQKQWLAVVRGNHWVVAKVARRKLKLDILRLSEFHAEHENGSEIVQEMKPEKMLSQKAELLKAWLHKVCVK